MTSPDEEDIEQNDESIQDSSEPEPEPESELASTAPMAVRSVTNPIIVNK